MCKCVKYVLGSLERKKSPQLFKSREKKAGKFKTNKTKTTDVFFGFFVFINGTAILVLF